MLPRSRSRQVASNSGKQDREAQKNISRIEKQIEQLTKKKKEIQADESPTLAPETVLPLTSKTTNCS